jgi:hypothetical protein
MGIAKIMSNVPIVIPTARANGFRGLYGWLVIVFVSSVVPRIVMIFLYHGDWV